MTSITLALDFGASNLRAIVTTNEFKPQLFLLDPQIMEVSEESLKDYQDFRFGSSDPTLCSFIEYQNKYYALGSLANKRFKGGLNLDKRKFELAILKVLAIVGAISEIKALESGNIGLGVLLPYGEFRDRDLLESVLQKALLDFKFCNLPKSFKLETFVCLPEGGGVLTQARVGKDFKNLQLVVFMLGFRDASLLFIDRGEMNRGLTYPIGFYNLVSAISQKISFYDYPKLTQIICKAGKNINTKALKPLLNNIGDSYKEYEINKISKIIMQSRNEYWLLLKDWLSCNLKDSIDEIIVAGGTSQYFKPELNALLSFSKIVWCSELENRINSTFTSQIKSNFLQYRLGDVYGLFFYLYSKTNKSEA